MSLIQISIHALRKESDRGERGQTVFGRISIHALRKESDSHKEPADTLVLISIHALRKESDIKTTKLKPIASKFQSTLSVRRATRISSGACGRVSNFNPRSP